MAESTDSSGVVIAQYFDFGQAIGGSNYFYTKDQAHSIREMTNGTGNIVAQYAYDPYGRVTNASGTLAADFQFANYYFHAPSGLGLTLYRAYNANLGRWINRDPIADQPTNLYCYVLNEPINSTDFTGLFANAIDARVPFTPGDPNSDPPDGRDPLAEAKCILCCARRLVKANLEAEKNFGHHGDLKKLSEELCLASKNYKDCLDGCKTNHLFCNDPPPPKTDQPGDTGSGGLGVGPGGAAPPPPTQGKPRDPFDPSNPIIN